MWKIIIFNSCGSSVTFLVDSLTLGVEKSWYENSLSPSGKLPVKNVRVKPEILNIYQVQKFRQIDGRKEMFRNMQDLAILLLLRKETNDA